MLTLGERIKKVRKELNLTQQAFANQIGTTQNNIASYEIGRREPSAAALNNICKTFNLSESWLRTGEGEMFIQVIRNQEIADFVERVLQGEEDNFKLRLVSALSRLNESDWEVLERLVVELGKNVQVGTECKEVMASSPDVDSTAAAEALYRSSSGYVPPKEPSVSSSIGDAKMA